jgi:hypothetical protein
MALLTREFNIFHDRISLGAAPQKQIQSAVDGLRTYLSKAYEIDPTDVILQGSVSNGTAVEPARAGGEYDVDLVVVGVVPGEGADHALAHLKRVLAANGVYVRLLRGENSRKKPCVRLFYAATPIGNFHVDVVPAQTYVKDMLLKVPRRGEGWHITAPVAYARWCQMQGSDYIRIVKMLKRWRDVHQPAHDSIKSIVLQVLAATQPLSGTIQWGTALWATLSVIERKLTLSPNTAPQIPNPILPKENLAARWDDVAYRNFRRELRSAVALAQQAVFEQNPQASAVLWRELLGDDFPDYAPPGVFRLASPSLIGPQPSLLGSNPRPSPFNFGKP